MSGADKSYWTRKLAASGFRAISIDDRIQEKLAPELNAGAYPGIDGVAEWMGWPDQPVYRERQQSAKDAVARCYPRLIACRKQLCGRYAHRIVPMERLRDAELDAGGFLELLFSQARPVQ
jgi:hypothetical protein